MLDDADYRGALLAKPTEETQEARRASSDQLAGELADVLEVLQTIANAHGLSWEQVLKVATVKRADRGSFDDRIFLESVETPD